MVCCKNALPFELVFKGRGSFIHPVWIDYALCVAGAFLQSPSSLINYFTETAFSSKASHWP